jgi:hypothetical protein
MKKDQPPRKRLTLPRETVRQLGEADLKHAAGGTCYTDVRVTQCLPEM